MPDYLGDPAYFATKVVGVSHEGRQAAVKQLQVNDQVVLRREPDNAYDPNAVHVETQAGVSLGYISAKKNVAARLATRMDDDKLTTMDVIVAQTHGGGDKTYFGFWIAFKIPEHWLETA